LRRQRGAKRAIEPRPRAHGSRGRLFQNDFAGAVETDHFAHGDAHRRVERDAGATQDRDELRMSAEPNAAAGQIFVVALEHDRVPTAAAKKVCRQQPAERSADDERTAAHASFPAAPEARTRNP
jgi:hypothetical protein